MMLASRRKMGRGAGTSALLVGAVVLASLQAWTFVVPRVGTAPTDVGLGVPTAARPGGSAAADGGLAATAVAGLGLVLAGGLALARAATVRAVACVGPQQRGTSAVALEALRHATPQLVPVVDLEGKKIGEECLNFHTLSRETANYVVHQENKMWLYTNKQVFRSLPKRWDVKKGRKPWAQKGSGRARHGSRYGTLFGKSFTHQKPYGLSNKRKLKSRRLVHCKAISTVLQSKWRNMWIVQGLDDWPEPRQGPLEEALEKITGLKPGNKPTLMITRSGWGQTNQHQQHRDGGRERPLYMSGRLIPRLAMRRPREIDPTSDGLFQCLKGRNIVISREAFFDLQAKFNCEDGWAWQGKRFILLQGLQRLAKQFPMDRGEEISKTRELPFTRQERREWAREMREELAAGEAA